MLFDMKNFGYAGHSCIVHGLSGAGKETLVVYLECVLDLLFIGHCEPWNMPCLGTE